MVKNINIMNYKVYLIIIAILIASCIDDSEHGPYGADNIPPGQVTVDEVVNTAGGAIIYFTPPSDEDLLYVKAAFEDENEIEREVIVSAVIDSLSIVGFAEEGTYPVEVFAVDRGENQSAPTIVNISPLEAPIHAILNSMEGTQDFGGINISYLNPFFRAPRALKPLKIKTARPKSTRGPTYSPFRPLATSFSPVLYPMLPFFDL